MNRVATRCTKVQSTTAPRFLLGSIRSNLSTVTELSSRRSQKRYQQRFAVPKKARYERIPPQTRSEVLHFRQVTDAVNQDFSLSSEGLQTWIEQFLRLGSLQLLRNSDCSEVVRILHNLDRTYRKGKDHNSKKLVHSLVESVRQAYVSGSLPWTGHATLHLLSYYKESGHLDEGLDFWKWLSRAEGVILDPVYIGAAIEFLAVCGVGLRYCEEAYERTLAQQRDIGSQYYLTPGAILPDRSKAVTTSGTSSGLLQGILSARLLYGNWQGSYLTLDTVFALRPTQAAPRFLDAFVYERPIFEALPVFFMYCRGGNAVSKVTLTTILKLLRDLANRASHYRLQLDLVGTMFRVVEAYIGAAGHLDLIHLNVLTSAFVNATPQLRIATPAGSTESQTSLQNTVMGVLIKLFALFHRHNASPTPVTFGEIILRAVSLGNVNLAKVAFQDMLSLDMLPSEPTAVCMIKAAALLRDPELLKSAWACVRKTSMANPDHIPDARKWKSFAAAAASCSLESFVEEQVHSLPPESLWRIRSALTSVEKHTPEQLLPPGPTPQGLGIENMDEFGDFCDGVRSSLEDAGILQTAGFRNFHEHPIDEPPIFAWPETGKETWQRKLYDDLTMEQSSKDSRPSSVEGHNGFPNGVPEAMPDISNTGIPFDELRYANWKTINNLLVQAEAWERHAKALAETDIKDTAEQKTLPRKRDLTNTSAIHYPVSVQQFKVYQQDIENERDQSADDAGKPTGDGGGGGGCWILEVESVNSENLGRGEAMTALDKSWPRQLFVARERRRRFGGSGEDIVGEPR
ncbi:MAG: hypothetical protein Q9210_000652 [Variospora velana]